MKAGNLKILQENRFNVPKFFVVEDIEDLKKIKLSDKLYAVRSSGSYEDGEKNSYAGQFRTYLNVPPEEVPEKIRLVKNSVNAGNVDAYESAKSIKKADGRMRVVVQEMIDADISGVIFYANPLGILNEAVITCAKGTGENLVNDRALTTSYYVNKDDLLYYTVQNEGAATITKKMIKRLLNVAKRAYKVFGEYMDIEFAIKDDIIYILQARKITTVSNEAAAVIDNSNIVESFPNISCRLTADFAKDIYYNVFKRLVLRMTKDKKTVSDMDADLKDMVEYVNGRIYYTISNWYMLLKLLPFSKKTIEIWQNMLGVKYKKVSKKHGNVKKRIRLKVACSFIKGLKNNDENMKKLNVFFNKRIAGYKEQVFMANDINSLLKVYKTIRNELCSVWDYTLINDMYTFVFTYLSGKKNKEYISNIKNLESMKPVIQMYKLKKMYNKYGEDSTEFKKAFEKYIEEYGDRCINELKLETKTYRTNPEILKKQLKNMDMRNLYDARQKKNKKSFFVKRAKMGIKNREISRMNRTKIFGITRNIFLKIGKLLKDMDYLESERDIFYLSMEEIETVSDKKETVAQRKEMLEAYKNLPAYTRLVYDRKPFDTKQIKIKSHNLNDKNELFGEGTSMGIVKGEVCIVDENLSDTDVKGKIIVTKSTDPGWVFLIQNCIGIIAERGSMLSHTAIISRELNKPAVVGVKDAMSILKNKDIVSINAYTGRIKVEQREEVQLPFGRGEI